MSSFCTAKATHIFSAKNISIFAYHSVNFNELLTNDIVSFEQLGPEWQLHIDKSLRRNLGIMFLA